MGSKDKGWPMTPQHSISFDRAAGFYDQTRKTSPDVAEKVTQSVLDMLPAGAALLEIGVGTGRISVPLIRAGLRVTGVDLSCPMMQRIALKLPSGSPPPSLAQADAARLPLSDDAFEAVIAVHVFHLIADWRMAIQEIRRVLRPGGRLLAGYDWRPPDSPTERLHDQWRQIIRQHAQGMEHPGVQEFEQIKEFLHQTGAQYDKIEVAGYISYVRIDSHIQDLQNGVYSSTWRVPEQAMPACIAELRSWAQAEFGDLDKELSIPRQFIWDQFRW
jgi:ubiquinone/menaquinone biosynthesis C-methylase UbiE